jgi:hypothetical protein
VRAKLYDPEGPGPAKVSQEMLILVDVEQSSWNVPVDDRAFSIGYPRGTRVHDELTGADMIVGADQ